MKKKEEAISLRYIDKELYDRLYQTVQMKGGSCGTKTELFNYIFQDYLQLHEIEGMNNPYLIRMIREIVTSAVNESEKRLGGRLFKLTGELAINVSVLNQIIYDYMNKFGNDEESRKILQNYREYAVEQMRENKFYPITYARLVKNEDDSSWHD